MPEIIFYKVTIGYPDHEVAEDITFTIEKDDFVIIFGPNGAGKTTLAKTMLGILRPLKGETYIFGCPVTGVCPHKKMIGYVPQFYNVNRDFPATLYDVVISGCYPLLEPLQKIPKEYKEQAIENLKRVGLLEHKDKPFAHLSGGQQKRGLIARALMGPPKALLLDEPTAGVDIASEIQVNEVIVKTHKNFQIPVIVITHDVNPYLEVATKFILMGYGKYFAGSFEDVIKPEVLSEVYQTKVDVVTKDGLRFVNVRDVHHDRNA
ncbi:MAG: metal ABC transporter ATP-binding protein [bacterium]|nr:metal ABC transporter ATP-binding protein [bacterium]